MKNYNAKCHHCSAPMKRKNSDLKKYKRLFCSRICFNKSVATALIKCSGCETLFKKEKRKVKHCSRACANKSRFGTKYFKNSHGNSTRQRLNLLKEKFKFKCCMIRGCEYDKTFDVHRFVEGRCGGQYVIGNMFAICPNHHAEITRKLIVVKKVSDKELLIINKTEG